jgi:hypothetical protein
MGDGYRGPETAAEVMGATPYKAFVSSTYEDLKSHRAHVIDALRNAGIFVDPMEDWTAESDEPKKFSAERVEGCNFCVLLVALRRGFIPKGESKSITQMEYQAAIDQGIDVLVFLLDEEEPWPRRFDQLDDDLRQWRRDLETRHGRSLFRLDPVTIEIAPALTRWVTKQARKVTSAGSDSVQVVSNVLGLPKHEPETSSQLSRADIAHQPHPVLVWTLELDSQLEMMAKREELVAALDELLFNIENGRQVSISVTVPEFAAARDELEALRLIEQPTVEQRRQIMAIEKRLRGRSANEPPFDQLLEEVITTFVVEVVPRLRSVIGNAQIVLDCIVDTLRLYEGTARVPRNRKLECLARKGGWSLTVWVPESFVDPIAAEHVAGFDYLVWGNTPVYIGDFPDEALRQYFIPQMLMRYFLLKYWHSSETPAISEVFDLFNTRVVRA